MRRRSRRGTVVISVLLLLPMLFLVMVLAIHAAELVRVRSALQANADAAALAAAAALVDDSRLVAGTTPMPALLQRARDAAQASAHENVVAGKGIDLHPPRDEDKEDADVEFGHKASPDAPFEIIRAARHGLSGLGRVNAVQVIARRTESHGDPLYLLRGPFLSRVPTDAAARAVVLIERDIIGVRPPHGLKAPLVPIALLSDPDAEDERSWEYSTEARKGPDRFTVLRGGKRPVPAPGSDGLHEMKVTVGGPEANAVVLSLGGGGAARQTAEGVAPADLAGLGGELVLTEGGPAVPRAAPGGLEEVGAALSLLLRQGEARVFPLYRKADRDGRPVLSGLVAARVLAVEVDLDGTLRFVLQPAMRVTPAGVTASSRGLRSSDNKYLGRLRLAD